MAEATTAPGPVLLEIDEASWTRHIDRVEGWLRHVVMVQAEFRALAHDTAAKVREPHWHEYLTKVAEAAVAHEAKAQRMFEAIGRSPSTAGTLAGVVTAKAREGLAGLVGALTGASSPWRDLQQLYLVSLGAMGAFAVAEQLGYAVGLPSLSDLGFEVASEKMRHHRLIQEAVLEFASMAILYESELGSADSRGQGT